MATERQIEANRKNSQLSTGPRGAEGKSKVASNALKHGLTGKQIVLPHEDAEEFEAFASGLHDALAPVGAVERLMVEKIVGDAWRIRRVPILEAALHARAKQEDIIGNINRQIEGYEKILKLPSIPEFINDPSDREGRDWARAKLQAEIGLMEEHPLFSATRTLQKYERELGNLARHEEALLRSMLKMLQRLQAERAGKHVSAPAVLDVHVDANSHVPDSEPTPSGNSTLGTILSNAEPVLKGVSRRREVEN